MGRRGIGLRARTWTFPKANRRLSFEDSSSGSVEQSPAGQPSAFDESVRIEDVERCRSANSPSLISSRGEKFAFSRGPFIRCDQSKLPPWSSSKGSTLNVGPSQSHYKERFVSLQTFLKGLDQQDPGEYMQMLRSLSAADRSKHAVELEKRAIQLLLEEGAELQKMKRLKVLGQEFSNQK